MRDRIDVAIVGAGPYGLSIAAHLRGAGVSFREFGHVMHAWRTAMPRGMFLNSPGRASSLSDPAGTHTLAAFCRATGRPYADDGMPVPLATFIAYGEWFQAELAPNVEETTVTRVAPAGDGGFTVSLATGEDLAARQVVVATGVEHFAYLPAELASLPPHACTHSSAHVELSAFSGRQVVVVGAGQSALETAAILSELGAAVQLVMRRRQPVWNGPPPPQRPLYQRLHEPEAGVGSGWSNWFYCRYPELFRYLPATARVQRARTALGPAGANWLRARVEGAVPILGGQSLRWAEAGPARVRLGLAGLDGKASEVSADHVIAATGYRPDIDRLTFLDERLRRHLRTLAGTPAVGAGYQSSMPGLYFAGPGVAPTFGPVMRFVYGAAHAARTIAPRLGDVTRHDRGGRVIMSLGGAAAGTSSLRWHRPRSQREKARVNAAFNP